MLRSRRYEIVSAKLELARRNDDQNADEAWMSFETESAPESGANPSTPASGPAATAKGDALLHVPVTALEKRPVDPNLTAVPSPAADSLDSLTARVRASSAATAPAATATVGEIVRKPWHQHPLFRPLLALAVLAIVVIGATYLLVRPPRTAPSSTKSTSLGGAKAGPNAPQSTAVFTSEPAGATVTVDAVVRGVTPLKLQLLVGDHVADFTYNDITRSIPFDLAAATTATQHVEFPAGNVANTGKLDVTSDPSGASVSIDGAKSGRTPLSLAAIGVGRHTIVIGSGDTNVQRTVNVTRGATATLAVTMPTTSSSAGGWITFKSSAADLQVREKGEIIGTTSASRLMLPAGRHDLELVSEALEFRTSISVQVKPGTTTSAAVSLPNGSLSVNASPWAEVSVDGRSLGTTPLANVPVPIGTHEIVWRHPQLGERRRTITLSARTPVRVGMDFSR